ncbi:regulator of G-protein signaling 9-like, partial [Denticeps clupeoides]|uniref:regulator of G-protein signaling 9-like n=1 Tax=Denticeps clupeoides TaxID=299321 RepID=UPI0010A435BE
TSVSVSAQLCRFTAPVPHLAVYSGFCQSQATASPGVVTLPNSAACPSPISVAIDSTPASERRCDSHGGPGSNFPSIVGSREATSPAKESQTPTSRPRATLSLSRFLRRGCAASSVFASLSPKCGVAAGSGRVQPLGMEPQTLSQPRRSANFFQIKVDIPPECRIYPIDSEDEQESPGSAKGAVKEIICPWESITKQDGAG